MAIADTIMSGVRAARSGDGQSVDGDEAARIITELRAKIPSLRTPNGQQQLRQTLDKLGRTTQLTGGEVAVLKAAVDGNPGRLSPQPTVHTHTAPSEGHSELYAQRFAGGAPPNEGYHAIRSRLMHLVHEAQEKHDQNGVHVWRDLVEALDNRFNKAATAEKSDQVERWLSLVSPQATWPTVDQIRAKAFDRPEPAVSLSV